MKLYFQTIKNMFFQIINFILLNLLIIMDFILLHVTYQYFVILLFINFLKFLLVLIFRKHLQGKNSNLLLNVLKNYVLLYPLLFT